MPMVLSGIIFLAMILALIDIITKDESSIRYLPKLVWIILVILVPMVGSIIWFVIGHEYKSTRVLPPPSRYQSSAPSTAPSFSAPPGGGSTEEQLAALEREIEESEKEAKIRKLEAELKEKKLRKSKDSKA